MASAIGYLKLVLKHQEQQLKSLIDLCSIQRMQIQTKSWGKLSDLLEKKRKRIKILKGLEKERTIIWKGLKPETENPHQSIEKSEILECEPLFKDLQRLATQLVDIAWENTNQLRDCHPSSLEDKTQILEEEGQHMRDVQNLFKNHHPSEITCACTKCLFLHLVFSYSPTEKNHSSADTANKKIL